ncbi:hypothetical protein B0H13DRAFT_1898467 [Mycena leptocephala]|nr:hypothetical protein B0H13DRAFT_1898467 [Mycena leptocephala]
MLSLASLTAVACIIGAVSATPLARQATCSPNFEGAPVSIMSGAREWGVWPVLAGTLLESDIGTAWHVEQTGSANPTFIIKAITGDNSLVVDVVNGLLTLEEIDSRKQTQNWEIECNQCNPGASSSPSGGEFAVGCAIKSIPSGLCVQLEHTTDIIGLGQCSGAPSETFDFWTAAV